MWKAERESLSGCRVSYDMKQYEKVCFSLLFSLEGLTFCSVKDSVAVVFKIALQIKLLLIPGEKST